MLKDEGGKLKDEGGRMKDEKGKTGWGASGSSGIVDFFSVACKVNCCLLGTDPWVCPQMTVEICKIPIPADAPDRMG
jgi:hypothetical protein